MPLASITCDVGSGYTGILAGHGGGAALVDFGAGRPGGRDRALQALNRVVSPHRWPWWWPYGPPFVEPGPFDAFVLSHPHTDHYNGLRGLAREPSKYPALDPLLAARATFFHPRLPEESVAREFLVRLVALNRVTSGVPEFALTNAIARCTQGSAFSRRPLCQGDSLALASESFDVLWPPEHLPAHAKAALRNLVQRYDTIARDAAKHGDNRLQRAVEGLRSSEELEGVEDAVYGPRETSPSDRPPQFALEEENFDGESKTGDENDAGYEQQVAALKKAVTRGANLLSLVFASSEDRRYVFLGDIDRSLHGEIAPYLRYYEPEVVLSAHHGTHFGPALADLCSRYVVSSVGDDLADKVCPEYAAMGMHLRTDSAGDIALMTHAGRTCLHTRPTRR